MMDRRSQENVYSESELLDFIQGLDNIYWIQPWYKRWMWTPWHLALITLSLQLCATVLNVKAEKQEAVEFFEDQL